jgi:hypothetical protein
VKWDVNKMRSSNRTASDSDPYLQGKLESIYEILTSLKEDIKELKIDVMSLKEDRVKFNTYFKIAAIVSWLVVGLALGTTEHMLEGLHVLK